MVMLEMHRERIKDITGRIKGSCPTDRRLWCNIMVEIESMFFSGWSEYLQTYRALCTSLNFPLDIPEVFYFVKSCKNFVRRRTPMPVAPLGV